MGISRHDIDLVLPKHALAPEKLRQAMSLKSRDKAMTHQCQGVISRCRQVAASPSQ